MSCATWAAPIGIAVLQTFLTTRQYFHFNTLSPSVSPFDEMTRQHIDQLVRHFLSHGVHRSGGRLAQRLRPPSAAASTSRPTQWPSATPSFLMGATLIVALMAALLLKKPAAYSAR